MSNEKLVEALRLQIKRWRGSWRRDYCNNDECAILDSCALEIEGLLQLHTAKAAQTQTAYFIGGPHATAVVHNLHHAGRVIEALCECTGDDVDDYTVTDLSTTS